MKSSLLWINKHVLIQLNKFNHHLYDAKSLVCRQINMTSWKPQLSLGQKPGALSSVDIDSTWSAIVYMLASSTNRATNLPTRAQTKRCPTWRIQRAQNQQTCCFHPITWLTKSYSTKWSPIAILPMMDVPTPTWKARHWWWLWLSAATKIFSDANGKSTFPVPAAAVNWNAMDGKVGFATWLTS